MRYILGFGIAIRNSISIICTNNSDLSDNFTVDNKKILSYQRGNQNV
jgi:hypothetical protein